VSSIETFFVAIWLAVEMANGLIVASNLACLDHFCPLFESKYWLIAAWVVPTLLAASLCE
jgi:hypothetical protein